MDRYPGGLFSAEYGKNRDPGKDKRDDYRGEAEDERRDEIPAEHPNEIVEAGR
jgi:hypothetical protein